MQCRRCQANNPADAKFCMSCGAAMGLSCPQCNAGVPADARFCPHCGRQLQQAQPEPARSRLQQYVPPELLAKLESARTSGVFGERRIVTMLFCDVKGSTAAASSLDPEEWTAIMNGAFQHLIAPVYHYEGTLARLMGDAILAFFGAPIAHEDDPQRAVLSGLAILEAIQPYREQVKRRWNVDFNVRIGINTGLVVVGEVGSDLRVEYTAMGDAVNLAARMEQTAEPGSVQITEGTHRLIAPLFEFQDLGGIEVKGKPEPVRAFRVLSAKGAPGRLRGIEGLSAPLIGRDREMRTLVGLVDGLRQGRGRIVSVMGEAGLGKSRLIAELRQAALGGGPSSVATSRPAGPARDPRTAPVRWLEGRSLSYQSSTPYAPFASLLGDCFGLRPEDNDAQKYAKVRSTVADVMTERPDDASPYLASLLGIKPTGDDFERVRYLEPPQLRERVFAATRSFLQCLASSQPLVLVLEDLHWSDSTSLDLVQQIMPLTDQAALMLLAVFRPQRQEPSWRFHETAARDFEHRYTPITLEPLDESDTRTLVANLLRIEGLPESVRALILRKSEGNPFFVEEVIRSLLDAGVVVRDGDLWRATRDIADIAVPDTIAGVLTTRLDRLDEQTRRVAQTASVIGREFDYDTLASVLETPQALEEALTDLQRRGLVLEKSRVPQRVYTFKHALTQETAYATLLLSRRRQLHGRAGESIERKDASRVGDIAWHFMEAREHARALPYLVRAGDAASRAYSTPEAIRFFTQALDLIDEVNDLDLARRAYEGLGGAQTLANDINGALETYRKMFAYGLSHGDIPMEVSSRSKMGWVTGMRLGQLAEAEEHLKEAELLARQCDDLPGLAEVHANFCFIYNSTGNFDNAMSHLSESAVISQQLDIKPLRLYSLTHMANTQVMMTRFDEGWASVQQARQLAEELGHRQFLAELSAQAMATCYLRNGDVAAAENAARLGVTMGAQVGSAMAEGAGRYFLGQLARFRGDYEQAVENLQEMLRSARASGMFFFEAAALCALGGAYADISEELRGQTAKHHAEALKIMERPMGQIMGAMGWVEIASCALAAGNLADAEDLFQRTLTQPTAAMYVMRPQALLGSAFVALARHDSKAATALVEEARQYVEERRMQHFYPPLALAEAFVRASTGEVQRALEQFNRAERLALQLGMRPVVLQARAGQAQVLAAMGRTAEAIAALQGARAMIDEIAGLFKDSKLRELFLASASRKLPALV